MNIEKLKELLALDEKLRKAVDALEAKYQKMKEDLQAKYQSETNEYSKKLSQKDSIIEQEAKAKCAQAEKEINDWYEKEVAAVYKVDSSKLVKAKSIIEKHLVELVQPVTTSSE